MPDPERGTTTGQVADTSCTFSGIVSTSFSQSTRRRDPVGVTDFLERVEFSREKVVLITIAGVRGSTVEMTVEQVKGVPEELVRE